MFREIRRLEGVEESLFYRYVSSIDFNPLRVPCLVRY